MTRPTLTEGQPEPLGVSLTQTGLNVAVVSTQASAIAVSVFDASDREIARLPLLGRTGDVFHGHIAGLGAGTRYGLRAFGPWDPAQGAWFNPAKLLVDPYATRLDRPFRLHPALFDTEGPDPTDTAPLVPKAIVEAPPPPLPDPPEFDWDRQVIQELHVRGFTMRHPAIPPALRGTFAGLGHPAAIAHLTGLGITTVELMPVAAWVDERHLPPLGLTNYWGYNPISFLTPDPRLAPGGWADIRAAVAALHAAGLAVIVDVVLNHTGESDALGPTLSFRGLDDALYYRRTGDDPPRYANDTGCGHCLALDRPVVWRLALDALRHWATRAGVDGFRLDLATTLGRRDTGFDPAAPLLAAIAADPILSRRAIIAEPWDIGPGGYQLGAFPAAWGEWNDRYRDTIRRFWRGDAGLLGDLATRFAGSADVFAPRHRPATRGINFITAHDGFTLADLVAHAHKHNAANGEANRDGTDQNFSWNNGAEGPTNDPSILTSRARDVRALLATLLLSRGTPMLSMGDECGRSQAGNNNAYAQDNASAWFDWDGADAALRDFTARLIALRQASASLRGPKALTGGPVDATLIPDVTWLSLDGRRMDDGDWRDSERRTLVAMLHSAAPIGATTPVDKTRPSDRAGPGEDTMLVVLHAGAGAINVTLPAPPSGLRWHVAIDSADPDRAGVPDRTAAVAPRSVLALRAEAAPAAERRSGVSAEALESLARAAGIAASWWDISGREHHTGDDTKRALLTALHLPCATRGDLRDSLHRLTAPRPLPVALTSLADHPIEVPVGPLNRPAWVTLRTEDGGITRVPTIAGRVTLPPPPMGRHQLTLDDDPATACHLTVAPARCFLPDTLATGQRRFGIAAHLYTLRGSRDQGIGDFTTLAELGTAAAKAGAAVIGLNPLHALFPGDRSRASPYHPSHRGFLDPIYLDIGEFPGADPGRFDALSAPTMVDHPAVWDAKRQALEAAFAAGGANDPALDAFIAAGGSTLRDFARFETIAARRGTTHWQTWPESLRHPTSPGVAAFAAENAQGIRFVCYMQMLADRQLGQAAARIRDAGLSIGLYRDLAIGCAPDGAEAWANQDMMLDGVSVGVPPDPFALAGQVWGLPPPDPLAMARDGFAGFAALLVANMRHAGALRIDHVLGLRRLFLVPDGASGSYGTYLDYPFHHLLGQLTLESTRARCLIVGEDLGTVPEGIRDRLSAAQVLSYRVLWFERDGPVFRPPATWPALAASCVSTHDLPTSRGWWNGADIEEQVDLGLLDAEAAEIARGERRADKAALIEFARDEGVLGDVANSDTTDPPDAAMHALIAATPCVLALVQADDLAGETVGVNLPGTDRERPNWRRRLRVPAAALCDRPETAPVLMAMRAAGRVDLPALEGTPLPDVASTGHAEP